MAMQLGQRPRKVPKGKFIWHNHVQHYIGMAHGLNGFRYRTGTLPVDYRKFMRCRCGVIDLPHYSIRPWPTEMREPRASLAQQWIHGKADKADKADGGGPTPAVMSCPPSRHNLHLQIRHVMRTYAARKTH